LEAQKLFTILQEAWNPLIYSSVNPVAYRDWKKSITMLIALVDAGSN